MDVPAAGTVADLLELVGREHTAVREMAGRLRVSVNYEVVASETELREGDEVAFLPPVSGGSGRCTLSDQPLDVGAVVARVIGPDAGGLVTAGLQAIRHLEGLSAGLGGDAVPFPVPLTGGSSGAG